MKPINASKLPVNQRIKLIRQIRNYFDYCNYPEALEEIGEGFMDNMEDYALNLAEGLITRSEFADMLESCISDDILDLYNKIHKTNYYYSKNRMENNSFLSGKN